MAGKVNSDRVKKGRNAKNLKNLPPAKPIKVGVIDYKDIATLRRFVSDRGKIGRAHV